MTGFKRWAYIVLLPLPIVALFVLFWASRDFGPVYPMLVVWALIGYVVWCETR